MTKKTITKTYNKDQMLSNSVRCVNIMTGDMKAMPPNIVVSIVNEAEIKISL